MYISWVEVSKGAIFHNLRQYQKLVGKSVKVMPIVKSNAYGHGMAEIAKVVSSAVEWIGVVNLKEALELRKKGIKNNIFVLSYAGDDYIGQGIKKNISFPIYDLDYAKLLSRQAKKIKKIVKAHIKIDTGATRVGVLENNAIEFIKQVHQLPYLKIEGVYSHFAASEENKSFTKKQLVAFSGVVQTLANEGIKIELKHFACSAASLVAEDSHFDMVRLGISLYGLWPSEKAKKIVKSNYSWFNLQPALAWKTKVLQVKDIPAGTKIGYGCTYTAKSKMKVAIIAVGYWEGYDRHLSNQGVVVVKNKKCSVVGRVCMNMTMVDVTKVSGVKAGDVVELIGQGNTADNMAEKIGTINYEVVTRINPELERVYLK